MADLVPPYALDAVAFSVPGLAAHIGRTPASSSGGSGGASSGPSSGSTAASTPSGQSDGTPNSGVHTRDIAIGALMAARLLHSLLPPVSLNRELRVARAKQARQWADQLSMPHPARMALFRTFDASAATSGEAASALSELVITLASHLDAASQYELKALAATLAATLQQQPREIDHHHLQESHGRS